MKVSKFGGTSLADAQQIKKVCSIIASDVERRLIVVSAPGKRFKEDIKVTDLLIKCAVKFLADNSAEKELQDILSRYSEIAFELGLDSEIPKLIESDLRQRLKLDTKNENCFIDSMKASGEDNTAKLVAAYFNSIGIKASYINPGEAGLFLSDEFGNAQVLTESYKNLAKLKSRDGILIFPGFFGYTLNGDVATFPRGGSDITGSILAAAVGASVYENFTDVDSVFAANPNIVKNPEPISALTYREMRELSYAGFSVLHEETLAPVYHAGIPVCIKNTNNPDSAGTLITTARKPSARLVVGVAGDKGFCSLYLSKYLMNREIGFGRKLLQILEEEGISYEHMPSGIDNISVVIREAQFKNGKEAQVIERIKSGLNVDDISVEHELAIIIIVGEGMQNHIGLSARAAGALAKAGINIEMINQGSSEISMMFGVKACDCDKAVCSLYEEFFR